jgi:hypothetical protein
MYWNSYLNHVLKIILLKYIKISSDHIIQKQKLKIIKYKVDCGLTVLLIFFLTFFISLVS